MWTWTRRLSPGVGERTLRGGHTGHGGAHWSGDTNSIGIVACTALNAVTRGKKGVEALNQLGVASKQGRDALDDAGSVDAAKRVSKRHGQIKGDGKRTLRF